MKNFLKRTKVSVLAIVFVVVLTILTAGCTQEKTTEFRYNLEEINDGVYAIYYVTHSRAPAYNYDVVTLNCNGSIKTFKGSVNITYTDNEPYANVIVSNYVNEDKIYVYIPKSSIKYGNDVDIK